MSTDEKSINVEMVPLRTVAESLSKTRPFAGTSFDAIRAALKADEPTIERLQVRAGAVLVEPDRPFDHYYVILDGETQAERPERDGSLTLIGMATSGEGFGESAFLTGKLKTGFFVSALRDSRCV